MLDNIMPETSFKGGFRIRNIGDANKAELNNLFKKRKQIFDNFENEGDVFITLRDEMDKKMYKFIKDKNLNFEYYMKINTHSGLDNEKPQELSRLISVYKDPVVKTLDKLKQIVKAADRNAVDLFEPKLCSPATSERIIRKLHISFNPKNLSQNKKLMVYNDRPFNRKVLISPENKFGDYYVVVMPNSKNMSQERYLVSKKGDIINPYNTPDAIITFSKNFKELVK